MASCFFRYMPVRSSPNSSSVLVKYHHGTGAIPKHNPTMTSLCWRTRNFNCRCLSCAVPVWFRARYIFSLASLQPQGLLHTAAHIELGCRSLTPSCCCLTIGPDNCPCHVCCILQTAWLQPPYSEHFWPAPPEVNLKGHTVPGTLKANSLVLVNFVHLGRSKIRPTAMSQPPIREACLQGELCNAELPSHLQKPLSLLECWCDSEKPASKLQKKLSFGVT